MERPEPRRLIVTADDFGRSHSINAAVIKAHQQGILTAASLMVNGAAWEEAVALARENPKLGLGLHLSLVCGRSALAPERIPGLVNRAGDFSENPVAAGFRYFARTSLKRELEAEMAAQFEKFHSTGLVLDHVNGHLNMHLHPTIFSILMRHARAWRIRKIRLTADPLRTNLGLETGRWFYRLSHWCIFGLLSRWARPKLREAGISHARAVFGLLQSGRVHESYVRGLIPRLRGDSELYSHPCVDDFKDELEALVSPAVAAAIQKHQVQLIRYQDL